MKLFFLTAITICMLGCQTGKKEKTAAPSAADSSTISPAGDTTTTHTDTAAGPDIKSLGNIFLEQPYLETIKALGNPDEKSKPVEWGADGLMHEDWTWKTKGMTLNMSSDKETVPAKLTVFSITALSPCTLKTKAGIGIGSSHAEIAAAYKSQINTEESSPDQVTIGSVYGGIIFTLENHKVSRIFLGAAAE
jgi:hypothetical protein